MWRICGGIMEKIKRVKLSLNSEAEVVVNADIEMKDEHDVDDIYFIMFNILHNPLRFVVATVGDFSGILQKQGHSEAQIQKWLATDPQVFMEKVIGNQQVLFESAEEKVRVILDSKDNAMMARAVVASMINNGFYWQHSHYKINGTTHEPKIQKVPTIELLPDLNQMLEIIKIWDTFDLKEFLMSQGASAEQVDALLNS